ncbi:otogelin [Gastrophryne carolinensis]
MELAVLSLLLLTCSHPTTNILPCFNGGECMQRKFCDCSRYNASGPRCQTVYNRGAERENICRTWGHAHYESFDGVYFYYPGRFTYDLLRHNEPDEQSFAIQGNLDSEDFALTSQIMVELPPCHNLGDQSKALTVKVHNEPECTSLPHGCSRSLSLYFTGIGEINLQERIVLHNNLRVPLPYITGNLKIQAVAGYILVQQPYVFSLAWDGSSSAYLKMSPEYFGRTRGLCGNNNWNPHDDLVTSYATPCGAPLVHSECIACCPSSCQQRKPCIDSEITCVDGCYCPQGLIFENDSCVQPSECPCDFHGSAHPAGSVVQDRCNNCTCSEGRWVCTNLTCPAECSVTGDFHIETFDGQKYTFQAPCQYILAKSLTSAAFTVSLQNVPCGQNLDSSCLQSVNIIINQEQHKQVTLTQAGDVLVQEQYRVSLPYSDGSQVDHSANQLCLFHSDFLVAKEIMNEANIDVRIPALKMRMATLPIQKSLPCAHLHLDVFRVRQLSSLFVQVKTDLGLQLLYDRQGLRLYLQLDGRWKDNTAGLCGTFNDNIQDDYLSPVGVPESTPQLFGNSWKTSSGCLVEYLPSALDPCDVHLQAASYALERCSVLTQELFAACHPYLSPVSYYEQCRRDTCKCGDACLCSTLAHYAYRCRSFGVTIDFRGSIAECGLSCEHSMVYRTCVSACDQTCQSLSATEGECDGECAEGCACPQGFYMNTELETCVESLCKNGVMSCESIDAGVECPPGLIYHNCSWPDADVELSRERTCENQLLNISAPPHLPCVSGCVCPRGLVKHGNECFTPDACPCSWKAKEYFPGDMVNSSCHTCVCHHGLFRCSFHPCPSMCTFYGDRHFRTFDGLAFDFLSVCQVHLVKALALSVTVENVKCYSSGVICRKSITIRLGHSLILLDDESGNPSSSSIVDQQQELHVWQAGFFTFVHFPREDVTVLWDQRTTVHIQVGPRWQGMLSGLCGNFDLKTINEMRTPENLEVLNPQEFGSSWAANECADSPDTRSPCALNPLREPFAKKECAILLSEVFEACHPVVDVTWFYSNCLSDTCGCSLGGDCECFCSSVAAYAHQCCQQGIAVDWRTPRVCPYDCEFYNKVLGKGPYRLLSYSHPGLALSVRMPSATVAPTREDSSISGHIADFMLTPGLYRARAHDRNLVSLELADRPNYFLCASGNGSLLVSKWQRSEQFQRLSTFRIHRNTWFTGYSAFESFARPGYFLRMSPALIQLTRYRHTTAYRHSTLFRLSDSMSRVILRSSCEWRYDACATACFRTCRDPSGGHCGTVPKVEGCIPQCAPDMVLDEITGKCVYFLDCVEPVPRIPTLNVTWPPAMAFTTPQRRSTEGATTTPPEKSTVGATTTSPTSRAEITTEGATTTLAERFTMEATITPPERSIVPATTTLAEGSTERATTTPQAIQSEMSTEGATPAAMSTERATTTTQGSRAERSTEGTTTTPLASRAERSTEGETITTTLSGVSMAGIPFLETTYSSSGPPRAVLTSPNATHASTIIPETDGGAIARTSDGHVVSEGPVTTLNKSKPTVVTPHTRTSQHPKTTTGPQVPLRPTTKATSPTSPEATMTAATSPAPTLIRTDLTSVGGLPNVTSAVLHPLATTVLTSASVSPALPVLITTTPSTVSAVSMPHKVILTSSTSPTYQISTSEEHLSSQSALAVSLFPSSGIPTPSSTSTPYSLVSSSPAMLTRAPKAVQTPTEHPAPITAHTFLLATQLVTLTTSGIPSFITSMLIPGPATFTDQPATSPELGPTMSVSSLRTSQEKSTSPTLTRRPSSEPARVSEALVTLSGATLPSAPLSTSERSTLVISTLPTVSTGTTSRTTEGLPITVIQTAKSMGLATMPPSTSESSKLVSSSPHTTLPGTTSTSRTTEGLPTTTPSITNMPYSLVTHTAKTIGLATAPPSTSESSTLAVSTLPTTPLGIFQTSRTTEGLGTTMSTTSTTTGPTTPVTPTASSLPTTPQGTTLMSRKTEGLPTTTMRTQAMTTGPATMINQTVRTLGFATTPPSTSENSTLVASSPPTATPGTPLTSGTTESLLKTMRTGPPTLTAETIGLATTQTTTFENSTLAASSPPTTPPGTTSVFRTTEGLPTTATRIQSMTTGPTSLFTKTAETIGLTKTQTSLLESSTLAASSPLTSPQGTLISRTEGLPTTTRTQSLTSGPTTLVTQTAGTIGLASTTAQSMTTGATTLRLATTAKMRTQSLTIEPTTLVTQTAGTMGLATKTRTKYMTTWPTTLVNQTAGTIGLATTTRTPSMTTGPTTLASQITGTIGLATTPPVTQEETSPVQVPGLLSTTSTTETPSSPRDVIATTLQPSPSPGSTPPGGISLSTSMFTSSSVRLSNITGSVKSIALTGRTSEHRTEPGPVLLSTSVFVSSPSTGDLQTTVSPSDNETTALVLPSTSPPPPDGPYTENECIQHICVDGQLIQVNKSQFCPYNSSQPSCGLLGFAVRINGDRCCPKWECACRCSIFPDLSFVTFDGRYLALYREAEYIITLSEEETLTAQVTRCPDSLQHSGSGISLCLTSLELTYLTNQIVIHRLSRKVLVNSRSAWPMVRKFGYRIVDTGNMYLIDTPSSLQVRWFHSSGLMVIESNSSSKASAMGLCGLCDGNATNDFILPNGRVLTPSDEAAEFLESWQIPYTAGYEGKERHRDGNCSVVDCSPCFHLILSPTFSGCHPYVSPEAFCELWAQDTDYTQDPCKALTAYAAMCHKFSICMDWRSPDFCPFQCPESLVYEPCLPVCDVPRSCQNNELDLYDSESCSALTEGCVCPEGSILHRPYSALCVPEGKCACTDSGGIPREIGETWRTSASGCCMYECAANDTITPVQHNCSDPQGPPCQRFGEIVVTVSDNQTCCPHLLCVCNQSLCDSLIPVCRKHERLSAYYQESSCCPRYTCGCSSCSQDIPTCQEGEILTVTHNNTRRCCPTYQCECSCEKIPRPECGVGEKLEIDEEFAHSAANLCNCSSYKCVKDTVCLSNGGGVLRPGQTIIEHTPEGTCRTSHCTSLIDPVTRFHLINVSLQHCAEHCQTNQVYEPPRDASRCCGRCRNVSCVQTLLNGTVLTHRMGGYAVSFLDGCCRTCKEDGKFCKRVTVRMTIRKNDCRSHTPVNIVSCDGKCPSASIYNYNINTYARFCKCCRDLGLQRRVVQLYCSGNSTWVNYSIQEPTDCSCQWS